MNNRLPRQPREWIDRDRPLTFSFEGRRFTGFDGDTISTALWANGVRVLGRSFKYHRPRGIFSLADADCNALMEGEEGTNIRADVTPLREGMMLKAVNTAGGVNRDRLGILDQFGRLTPVGFYYKAFHTPVKLFPFYESRIRQVAGLGRIDPRRRFAGSPKEYAFCDVLVVGAGPAGLSAALAAAREGARVMLIDENPHPGGTLNYQFHSTSDGRARIESLVAEVSRAPRVELRMGTTAVGYYADHWIALVDDVRLTKLRTRVMVVAAGCYEQPAVFRHNDLPGVMLAGAAQRLMHCYAIRPFSQGVVLTGNAGGYACALDLQAAGVQVEGLVDFRAQGEATPVARRVSQAGIPTYVGHALYETVPAAGKRGIRGTVVVPLDENGKARLEERKTLACDGVAMSAGWAPADGLLRQAGARMEYSEVLQQFMPVQLPPGIIAAGRVNGVYDLQDQLEDGRRAGQEAAGQLGLIGQLTQPAPSVIQSARATPNHPYPVIPHPKGKNFVDLDEDLQLKDFSHAVQEGFDSAELLKRYTAVGMGPSQGKHSNLAALKILSRLRGESMGGRQMTTARPFTTPVKLGHLAGRIFTPVRRTPLHNRHEELGAKFMYAGNWLRPEYYRCEGLTREACIASEAGNVRERVGLIDLSTLGKIEVHGPDAVGFLERIYTGQFAGLKVGMSRYGVMCDESGVVIDDGVVMRPAEDRFYISTTTTGAEGIYRELQRWMILWGLEVFTINVTNHQAAMNLAGPCSREILQTLTETDLGAGAFPYLGVREGVVAGVRARMIRVGFVGELGYEIHVPAGGALLVWDRLMEAGRNHGIRAFGVEAQRLLRLEKGHVIVGQDTDGLTHPFEAGMGWAVKMQKPFFVGQRSLAILQKKELTRQLVGYAFYPDYRGPVPKECHLVIEEGRIEGRVTSVGVSPVLGRIIGLAYVHPGRSQPGSAVRIRVDGGVLVQAEVVKIPFYDPENALQKVAPKGREVS